ncbi:MAG: aspartate aminotransferase family protein [Chloroflexi bacterium]|nr:aspartate aminotransferase family protein [Chloroflexota bacterium]MBP8059703.1 aspartate aminotransferase family protein [Chloroflexota bacterium]
MSLQGEKTAAAFKRAMNVIPYGVNSNFRWWGLDDTMVISKAQGPHIWDMDDNKYIDYRLAFGPIILGHSYPRVVEKVQQAITQGTLFALTTLHEIELAERICRMTGVDMVRLTNTGTEATMHALRIARAYTQRDKLIKFEGNYHGMHDYVLFTTATASLDKMGPRNKPLNVRASKGIPKNMDQYVINLPFNDVELLEETVNAEWEQLAAIFVEPTMGNAAGIAPQPGWLEKIRELCDKYGIMMIMDEVKTGFRLANGGAQEYFGVRGDLATYAKAMGNGFPVAAIGGKREVMMTVKPGEFSHGGTYIGNVAGVAAAIATLDILENEPIIPTIFQRGQRLMDGIHAILTRADIPHSMTGVPSMFGYTLGSWTAPTDFRSYIAGDEHLYEEIVLEMIKRGVFPESDGREPWFMCYSHDDDIIDETLNVFEDAVNAAAC